MKKSLPTLYVSRYFFALLSSWTEIGRRSFLQELINTYHYCMLMYTCIKQAVVGETIDREPEGISFPKVQFSGAVISHNEWEHWKLHEVIEGTASQFVQLHQILKVGDLTLPPAVQWGADRRRRE